MSKLPVNELISPTICIRKGLFWRILKGSEHIEAGLAHVDLERIMDGEQLVEEILSKAQTRGGIRTSRDFDDCAGLVDPVGLALFLEESGKLFPDGITPKIPTYSERLNKVVIARSGATKQSRFFLGLLHFVRNDNLLDVNLFKSFTINYRCSLQFF